MKTFLFLFLAMFGSFLPHLAAADNWQPSFSDTCSNIWWEQSSLAPKSVMLYATCELSGGTIVSSLDLGFCLTVDDNGEISGTDNGSGNWGDDADCGCGDKDTAHDGYTLKCTCTNSKGNNNYFNEFNLNQVVGNTAGMLYCYSTLGAVAH